jgi:hypothetical protein
LAGDAVGDAFDLLLRDVIACDQHAFVERHPITPYGWRPTGLRA